MKNNILKSAAVAMMILGGASFAFAETTLPDNLYMIGNATTAVWDCNNPVKMEKVNDYEFSFTGNLFKGELKFPWNVGDAMWGGETYMAMTNGEQISKTGIANGEAYLTHNGQPDNKWNVVDPGQYRLTFTIDKDDTAFGELKAEYLGELPNAIYMLGAATGQWDSNSGTPVLEENGVFTWTGNLNYYDEDKLFKFTLEQGEWDKVTFLVPAETNLNGNVLQIEPGTYSYQESAETTSGALKDWFWGIKEGKSGLYRISVNTTARTLTLELLKSYSFDKDNVTELYMLGLAAESFDSQHPLPMTSTGDGKFSWKGKLDFNTSDGDTNHANKQFKFVTPTGEWNKVYYLVPDKAESDGYIESVTPGTHAMKMTTWTDGKTGVDAFWGLTSGTSGMYTVTVDVPNMTMTLAKDASTGVSEIGASDDVSEEIYDLNGHRIVNLENAGHGVYIIRKGDSVRKVIL